MAVRHGYGKIAGADALVFAYDTGDTRNSYKGRPTTNYGPASFGNWGTEGSAERIATGNTYNGQPTYNCRTVVGESWRGIDTTISGLRTAAGSSGTVTMSCMVRNNNPSNYSMYAYIGHDFGSTRTIVANSNWQKVQWTVNQSSMNNDYVEFRPYTNNASVYLEMTMPMVEVNVTYASQFTAGTRSATQGLLDLTGNYTLDISNASFDSNAFITFDGSSDYIDILNSTALFSGTQDLTVEAAYSLEGQGGGEIFGNYGTGYTTNHLWFSGMYGLWISGGVYAPGYPLANGRYHMVGTRKNGLVELYLNGELVNSGTRNASIATDIDYRIGADVNGAAEPFTGDIYVVKAYNRALTAAEVKQNYNHYKTRFSI